MERIETVTHTATEATITTDAGRVLVVSRRQFRKMFAGDHADEVRHSVLAMLDAEGTGR